MNTPTDTNQVRNHMPSTFFGTTEPERFISGIQQAVNSIAPQDGIYAGDNLFTYHRNLGFLEDGAFMTAFKNNASNDVEKSILWRNSIVLWGARNGLKLEGDFVECGCYRGITARIVCDTVDFVKEQNRKYFLYDLFDHDESMPHHSLPALGKNLYAEVQSRFSHLNNVVITQGKVPDSLSIAAPDKIAFMHVDLNNAESEIGALDHLFHRMVPGAVLILDDYGWAYYRAQKLAEDPWFAARGYRVVELPTGQGMVIKQKD